MYRAVRHNMLSPEKMSIINSLLYFDIFDHPLTVRELCQSAKLNGTTQHEFQKDIKDLQQQGFIETWKGFVFLKSKDKQVRDRLSENRKVKRYLKIARFMARLISSFPYVRGVFISGSLSKFRMEKGGDIDFFIITAPGRLWISRTLLVLFKKAFLFNSYRFFCLNYFVDSDSLGIEERDLYTATEIATLIPVYNYPLYLKFMEANRWITEYYPNFPYRTTEHVVRPLLKPLKWLAERIPAKSQLNKLDDYLMQKMQKYRRNKFSWLNNGQFQKAFITRKNVSKHHPNDFRSSVLEKFRNKQKAFEHQNNILIKEKSQKGKRHYCKLTTATE